MPSTIRPTMRVLTNVLARDKVAIFVEAERTSPTPADVDLSRQSCRSLYFPKTTVVRLLREGLTDTEDAALRLPDEVLVHCKTRWAPRCVGDGAARGYRVGVKNTDGYIMQPQEKNNRQISQ